MAKITLKPITTENWGECVRLNVRDDQTRFVASNVYSLAESAFEPESHLIPLGVYDGETMVGFVMYGRPHFEGRDLWFIFRLMVDLAHQGKGYGRAAMQEVIKMIVAQPDCDEIYVSYEPENSVAAKLYKSLGFIDEGKMIEDEVLGRLPIKH